HPTRTIVEFCGYRRKILSVFRSRPEAASRGEDYAQILRQPFINPQKLAFHRLLIVLRNQPGRASIFAVPRMHEFMRDKSYGYFSLIVVYQRTLFNSAVVRFVMLQSEMGHVIAERKQKMVVLVMPCSEEIAGLLHQPLHRGDQFRFDIKRGFAVCSDVDATG